jgi:hypothetical protein
MIDHLSIGANGGPPLSALEAMTAAAGDLLELVSGSTASPVANEAQADALDVLLDDVRKSKGAATAAKEEAYRPLKAAADQVSVDWKPVLDKHDAAAAALKAALTPWRNAQKAIAGKLAQDARDAAAKLLEAAQATLRGDSDLEARYDAEDALKQAGKLQAQAKRIERAPTGLRTHYVGTITDRRALLQHVMATDADALSDWLDEYVRKAVARGTRVMPGVDIAGEKRA